MTSILVVGDIHSDPRHLEYIYNTAAEQEVDRIVQVGDFGFWEHEPGGKEYLDICAEAYDYFGIPLDWLDGNHENHPLLYRNYGPRSWKHKMTAEGFWAMRPGLSYIPRGTRWEWDGVKMIALGGAASLDKANRLKLQRKDGHERWWPTEEITDQDVRKAVRDRSQVDVMFTHDKPRDVELPWDRSDIPRLLPNQDKIQMVVNILHPKLLIHGHLHSRYTSKVDRTIVEGLGCNPQPKKLADGSTVLVGNPEDSWIKLHLTTT